MIEDDSRSVKTLMASLMKHGVPVRAVGAGTQLASTEQELISDGLALRFLGPPLQFENHLARLGDNSLSVVLKVSWKGRSILLPGDLEKFGMNVVLGTPIEKVDLLVAAHHGSKNSDPERFTRWCRPAVVVASCGKRKVGSKEKELFRSGHDCSVFTTNELGAIRFSVNVSGEVYLHRWDSGWKAIEP
jgi:competence protein ComEC